MSEPANINRYFGAKGYKVVTGTSPVTYNFYGFSVIAEAVTSAITAPTVAGPENIAYADDEGALAGNTLPVGFYPIRGSAITLSSGKVILWAE